MSLQIILVALNAFLLKAVGFFSYCAYRAAVFCAAVLNQHNFSYVEFCFLFFSPKILCLSVTLQNLLGITNTKVVWQGGGLLSHPSLLFNTFHVNAGFGAVKI